ncbi:MAG TPA: hypothetical protein VK501_04445 [Baekduia sp.]|uniref:hypothetical protein n=1 Tax=Baekduia sp. TaxID=2600305 RepID=UPI002CF49136|nr:hypothetical protein [Baekduia sp.]HMJ33147.1 hypothetical protein [Baekduia sp.]
MSAAIEALVGAGEEGAEPSVEDLRARLGVALELDAPAPEEVFRRAVDDPAFAEDLLTCRGARGFLQALFEAPATRAYARVAEGAGDGGETAAGASPEAGNRELVARAADAFVRWGRAGFSTVEEAVLARREAACLACPHLREPTATVQRLVPGREADRLGARTGRRVCDLCGCTTSRKIRLPTESCPGRDPADASLTRWGEPVA